MNFTDYEKFEQSSVENRRSLRQEELILEVTEALCGAMANHQISKSQIAKNLGKTKGFVSQLLAGGRNLTLRSIADVADAVGCKAHFFLADPQSYSMTNAFCRTEEVYPCAPDITVTASDFSKHNVTTVPMNIMVDNEEKSEDGTRLGTESVAA